MKRQISLPSLELRSLEKDYQKEKFEKVASKFKPFRQLVKMQSCEDFDAEELPVLLSRERSSNSLIKQIGFNCALAFANVNRYQILTKSFPKLASRTVELQDIIVDISTCSLKSRYSVMKALERLKELQKYVRSFKKTKAETKFERYWRMYFASSVFQCDYFASQYLKVDLFFSCLTTVSLSFSTKMTDYSLLPKLLQALEQNTISKLKEYPDNLEFIKSKRLLLLANYLEEAIQLPFRFKLDSQMISYRKKKIEQWKHTIHENMERTYIICKLCGESITLSHFNAHSAICFSSYETREKILQVNNSLLAFATEFDKFIKRLKFDIVTQVRKANKQLRSRSLSASSKRPDMTPIALDSIIQKEFRNKGLNYDFYPNYPLSLDQLSYLAEKYSYKYSHPMSKFREVFSRESVSRFSKKSLTIDIPEGYEDVLSISMNASNLFANKPSQKDLMTSIAFAEPKHRSSLSKADLSTAPTSKPRLSWQAVKPQLPSNARTIYLNSINPVPLPPQFSPSQSKLSNPHMKFPSFLAKVMSGVSGINRLVKNEKKAYKISNLLKKAAGLKIEEFKLKEKLKKWCLGITNLWTKDIDIELHKVQEAINTKIKLLIKFEEKFVQESKSTAPKDRFKRRQKSEDWTMAPELEEEQALFNTAKQKMKSLREGILNLCAKLIETNTPTFKLSEKLKNSKYRDEPDEEKYRSQFTNFMVEEYKKNCQTAISRGKSSSPMSIPEFSSPQKSSYLQSGNTKSSGLVGSVVEMARSTIDMKTSILACSTIDNQHSLASLLGDQKGIILFFSDDEDTQPMLRAPQHGDRLDDISSYNFIKILGKGGYGTVWLVQRILTGDQYAMKMTLYEDGVSETVTVVETQQGSGAEGSAHIQELDRRLRGEGNC